MTIDHYKNFTEQYESIRSEIQQLLDNESELPKEINNILVGILNEEYFDIPEINLKLMSEYNKEKWASKLFTTILRLESNEAFYIAEQKWNKKNKDK